ncbi:hypothetical protein [Labilibacter marinus]|uniref:hypothetical protein n=1 Tax=Labilibacter marinus TaxID=1477105 RepID=UPI00094FEAE2|nr:hypothetical protein [Labilibacter marinus]
MKSQVNLTEEATMEKYRNALGNVISISEIAEAMEELGYDELKIAEGKKIFNLAELSLMDAQKERKESSRAQKVFSQKFKELLKVYKLDRKKAKAEFMREASLLEFLGINHVVPLKYVQVMSEIKMYYSQLSDNADVLERLAKMKIDAERVNLAMGLIEEVEVNKLNCMKGKGESQDATQLKNNALDEIDDWMSEFYAVAAIALEDRPQLLEALGKVVKS